MDPFYTVKFSISPRLTNMALQCEGVYTVSSGYMMARELEFSPSVGASSSSGGNVFSSIWKSIWRAKVPPKVRIFIWKLSQDVIPTKVNLAR